MRSNTFEKIWLNLYACGCLLVNWRDKSAPSPNRTQQKVEMIMGHFFTATRADAEKVSLSLHCSGTISDQWIKAQTKMKGKQYVNSEEREKSGTYHPIPSFSSFTFSVRATVLHLSSSPYLSVSLVSLEATFAKSCSPVFLPLPHLLAVFSKGHFRLPLNGVSSSFLVLIRT
jgi:hypothetical protein